MDPIVFKTESIDHLTDKFLTVKDTVAGDAYKLDVRAYVTGHVSGLTLEHQIHIHKMISERIYYIDGKWMINYKGDDVIVSVVRGLVELKIIQPKSSSV